MRSSGRAAGHAWWPAGTRLRWWPAGMRQPPCRSFPAGAHPQTWRSLFVNERSKPTTKPTCIHRTESLPFPRLTSPSTTTPSSLALPLLVAPSTTGRQVLDPSIRVRIHPTTACSFSLLAPGFIGAPTPSTSASTCPSSTTISPSPLITSLPPIRSPTHSRTR